MSGLMNQEIERLLTAEADVPPPESAAQHARLKNYAAECEKFTESPEKFWSNIAQELSWFGKWDRVFDWTYPTFKWFIGAKCNITFNCLDRHVNEGRRNKVAYIWTNEKGEERQITYGQLLDLVSRTANALRSLKVKKGDRVVIYMPLCIESVAAMLACARIGAVHSVVYAGFSALALRGRILDAEARIVLTADSTYQRGKCIDLVSIVNEAIEGGAGVETVVVLRRAGRSPNASNVRELDFHELIKAQSATDSPEVMDAEDPLYILYTSGTTGKPKGVVHVHGGYMVGTYYHMTRFWDIRDNDVFFPVSDIGWIVGHSYTAYAPLIAGATTVIREGVIDAPDPEAVWQLVERYRVSVIFSAPTVVRTFMRHGEEFPQRHDLSSIRIYSCGGEPLNPKVFSWIHRVLCGNGKSGYVADNWWQTETGGPCIGTLSAFPGRPTRVGRALPGVVAEVVDNQGKRLPPNKGGLLVLRFPFPHMFRTVHGDPERYAQDWGRIPGAYATGDVAVCDEDGYFTVLGRMDDVLNVAGHRIGTADVEGALVSHPAVAEAAVIGRPDEIEGENIKAFVLLRAGHANAPGLEQQLKDHVERVLGAIAVPREIAFPDRLPKTRSGKILRRLLRAQELGRDTGDISTLED